MDPPSSTPASSLHLAMAALLGASLMAISAFYIHKRTVDQVLHRLIDIRRTPSRSSHDRLRTDELEQEGDSDHDNDDRGHLRRGYCSDAGGTAIDRSKHTRSLSRPMDENVLPSFRISGSLPNVASSFRTDWFNEQSVGYSAQGRASSLDNLKFLPPRLPPLPMDPRDEGIASIDRLKIPRSPSRNTFESVEDSDEEGRHLANIDVIHLDDENIDSLNSNNCAGNSNLYKLSAVPFSGEDANRAKNQLYRDISTKTKACIHMQKFEKIDSAFASPYLAGNDSALASPYFAGKGSTSASPYFAGKDSASPYLAGNDYTFFNAVRNTVQESTNLEEEDVCKMIRECLDLRKKYVYREKVSPWKVEGVEKCTLSKSKKFDPFHFEPVEATAHYFRMEDGVIHVYGSKNDTEGLFL